MPPRRPLLALLAALVSALAVGITSVVTHGAAFRRSTTLLVVAVTLTAAVARMARRWIGRRGAVALWLSIAPLAWAVHGVMLRHVSTFAGLAPENADARARLAELPVEFRLDAPIAIGLWRVPIAVALVWGAIAAGVALLASVLAPRVTESGAAKRLCIATTLAMAFGALSLALLSMSHAATSALPLVHRWSAALAGVAGIALLLPVGRAGVLFSGSGPYRHAVHDPEPQPDRSPRAAFVVALVALAAAPLATLLSHGVR